MQSLSTYALEVGKKVLKSKELKILDIISFAESRHHLNMTLFPMQKLIFKIFYQLPLSNDKDENCIIIPDEVNDKVLHEFSERECIDYFYDEKMINLTYEDIYNRDFQIGEINFFIGRRGSKTKMTTIISCYTLYVLFSLGNPHKLFNNKPVTDEICLTLVSNSKEGAMRQFRELTASIFNSTFFKPYLAETSENTGTSFWLKTPAFIDLAVTGKDLNPGNVRIKAAAANQSVRGDANIIVVMDEFCHYIDAEVKDKAKPLDEAMFEALVPSTQEFIDQKTKISYGKAFIISSPNGKRGMGYKKYEDSFFDKGVLMVNMPSFYVNRVLSAHEMRRTRDHNPESYAQEYLAQFTAKTSKWISNPDKITACFNENNPNIMGKFINKKYAYYAGIDYGFQNDGTAVAICHIETELRDFRPEKDDLRRYISDTGDFFVIDFVAYWLPNMSETLDIEKIVAYICRVCKTYGIVKGAFDQWSQATIERLHKQYYLHNVLECIKATERSNSDMSILLKTLINEGRLILPKNSETLPLTNNYKLTLQDELFNLTETRRRNQMIKVEDVYGHDDRYKAIEKAVFLAYTCQGIPHSSYRSYLGKERSVASVRHGSSTMSTPARPGLNVRDLSKTVF